MKYCYCCGAHLPDDFVFCPSCGKQQPQIPQKTQTAPQAPVQSVYAPVQQPAPIPVTQLPPLEPAQQYIPQMPAQNVPYCQIPSASAQQVTPADFPTQIPAPAPARKTGLFLGKAGLGLGIASLVTGVFFIIMYIIFAIVRKGSNFSVVRSEESVSVTLGVLAVIFSSIARKRGNYEKKSLLGLIFGIVGIVLGVAGVILFFVLFGGLGDFFSGNFL